MKYVQLGIIANNAQHLEVLKQLMAEANCEYITTGSTVLQVLVPEERASAAEIFLRSKSCETPKSFQLERESYEDFPEMYADCDGELLAEGDEVLLCSEEGEAISEDLFLVRAFKGIGDVCLSPMLGANELLTRSSSAVKLRQRPARDMEGNHLEVGDSVLCIGDYSIDKMPSVLWPSDFAPGDDHIKLLAKTLKGKAGEISDITFNGYIKVRFDDLEGSAVYIEPWLVRKFGETKIV